MRLKEHITKVQDGEVDILAHTRAALEECASVDSQYHYFTEITRDRALWQAEKVASNPKGRLAGVFITVKDCICVEGTRTQSSSRILDGYKPLFDATVIERLEREGAILLGRTVQDEFGFGVFSTNTGLDFPVPLNPFDTERATGGSSGGSAGATRKLSFPHVSLAESTGGSITSPSSLCGVFGLCPTYGRVSRYGLLDYGNSLDKIGPMGLDPYDLALVMEVISGHDERESTSLDEPVPAYSENYSSRFKGRIGIVTEALGEGITQPVSDVIERTAKYLRSQGFEVEEVSIPTPYKHGIATYYVLAQSESSTNLARYCGMRYGAVEKLEGNFNEYFSRVRGQHLGKEAKRRIIIGTFARMIGFRDAYYLKAMKVRTKIINEYKEAFSQYDVLLTPAIPYVAPRFDEIETMSLLQTYMADVLSVGPNLAGLPHMNMPVSKHEGLPIGVLGVADHLCEEKLLQRGAMLNDADI